MRAARLGEGPGRSPAAAAEPRVSLGGGWGQRGVCVRKIEG